MSWATTTARKTKVTSTPNSPIPFVSPPQTTSERVSRLSFTDGLDISGTCFRVIVGKDNQQKQFWVHENLFTSHSEFFRRASKEEWSSNTSMGESSSGISRTVSLPEDEAQAFQMYAALTYTGIMASRDLPHEWQLLVDVYILAERLQDTWAKNHIVDAMHNFIVEHVPKSLALIQDGRISGQYFNATALHSLYNGTPADSQARKLVVDLFADNITPEWLESENSLVPQEFLVDLTVRLLHKRSYVILGNMVSRPSSHYHEKSKVDEQKQKETPRDKKPASIPKPEAGACPPHDTKLNFKPLGSFSFTVSDAKAA